MTTLTGLLDRDAVPMALLHERYGALLRLVRKVLGEVPNCDSYLEIWPTAFRSLARAMSPSPAHIDAAVVESRT